MDKPRQIEKTQPQIKERHSRVADYNYMVRHPSKVSSIFTDRPHYGIPEPEKERK